MIAKGRPFSPGNRPDTVERNEEYKGEEGKETRRISSPYLILNTMEEEVILVEDKLFLVD